MNVLFRIGARGSNLSLAQTELVRVALSARLGVEADAIEIIPIITSGDRVQDRLLIDAGGKGLFTKELDEALIDSRIDLAVHSLKDLPTRLPDAIALACVPEREDPRDAFVSLRADTLAALAPGAVVGSASLRRQAQTLFLRPDLRVAPLRGNVETRLNKLEAGAVDATFLALAGLRRLGLDSRASSLVDPNVSPPAACQGALAITTRADDTRVRDALSTLENASARIEIETERAFLRALDGSCRTAIGALARCVDGTISFTGEALTTDGGRCWRRSASIDAAGDVQDTIALAHALGQRLGGEISAEAGDALQNDAS